MSGYDGIEEEALEIINGAWRAVDGRFWILPHRQPPKFDPAMQEDYAARIEKLARRAANQDPTIALMSVVSIKRRAEDLEREVVALARSCHWSWRDIGDMLGMSRSSAQRRYGPR